jgi:hypothetical protein
LDITGKTRDLLLQKGLMGIGELLRRVGRRSGKLMGACSTDQNHGL